MTETPTNKARREREQFAELHKEPFMVRLAEEAETTVLWHGLRSTLSSAELSKRGFSTFRTWLDGRLAIERALEYFGKKKLLTIKGHKVRGFIDEVTEPYRRTIWVTTHEEDACSWAQRNPEIIFLTLHFAGVSDVDVLRYLRTTFGNPYKVKLKFKPSALDLFRNPSSINTFKTYIKPDEIELVEKCTDIVGE